MLYKKGTVPPTGWTFRIQLVGKDPTKTEIRAVWYCANENSRLSICRQMLQVSTFILLDITE